MEVGGIYGVKEIDVQILWWRDLKEVWSLDEWKDMFEANFSWEVGNGREIKFWEDRWAGCTALKELFLRLHSTCSSKDSFVWQIRERSENSRLSWKIEWRRNLFE